MNTNRMTGKVRTLLILMICFNLPVIEAKTNGYELVCRVDEPQELILTVTPSNYNVGTEAGSVVFSITSNTAWEVSDDADWLNITPISGNGDGTITATYTANNQPVERIGNITISGTGISSQKITVTQKAFYTLSIEPDMLMLDACYYNAQQITVKSNASWTVTFDINLWWLTVSPMSGTGDGIITVSAYENIEPSPREAVLTFTLPDGYSKVITIMQSSGTWVFVEPNNRIVEAEAGNTSFTADIISYGWVTYCADAYENLEWITVEPVSICGYQEIVVFYTANKLSQKRTGEVCFFPPCGGVGMCVTITQNGAPAKIDITPSTIQLGYQEGSNAKLSISASIEWSTLTSESWLTLSQSSGTGDGEISVTAHANASLNERNSTITFSGPEVENKVVTVTQAGAPPFLETSVSSLPLSSAEGASGTFDIASNTNWTAQPSESWLTVSNGGSFGNATITVTAQKNPTINTRNATVTIKATDLADKTVIVSQVGAPTSINEFNDSRIKIYPNPANNSLFFEGISQGTQVSVYDQSGRLLIKSPIKGNHIDISTLISAVYTVILMDDKEKHTFRFVKE